MRRRWRVHHEKHQDGYPGYMSNQIQWLSTGDAAKYLGITTRTLYRFIDEGHLAGYRFGRVIRLKQADVDQFIDNSRIEKGSLEHLYPDVVGESAR